MNTPPTYNNHSFVTNHRACYGSVMDYFDLSLDQIRCRDCRVSQGHSRVCECDACKHFNLIFAADYERLLNRFFAPEGPLSEFVRITLASDAEFDQENAGDSLLSQFEPDMNVFDGSDVQVVAIERLIPVCDLTGDEPVWSCVQQ